MALALKSITRSFAPLFKRKKNKEKHILWLPISELIKWPFVPFWGPGLYGLPCTVLPKVVAGFVVPQE